MLQNGFGRSRRPARQPRTTEPECDRTVRSCTANLPTNIVDFRGLDSSIILILSGGILMSIGDFPESLSQAMLVGIMVVGGLGVQPRDHAFVEGTNAPKTGQSVLGSDKGRGRALWDGSPYDTFSKVGVDQVSSMIVSGRMSLDTFVELR